MMFYLLLFSVSWGGLFSLTIRGEKLHSPYASVITRAKDAWVMGEFVVIGCSDDCYDVESDIWEEMSCGACKGEGGADDVLFFPKVGALNSHRKYSLGGDVLLSLDLF